MKDFIGILCLNTNDHFYLPHFPDNKTEAHTAFFVGKKNYGINEMELKDETW